MIKVNKILNLELNQFSRVLCLVYIIQLTLKDLITHLKIKPKNNKIIIKWNEEKNNREKHSEVRRQNNIP
jgi:hypothetical protein